MRIALCEHSPLPGDTAGTLQQIGKFVKEAGRNGLGADIIVFPELYITGYFPALWKSIPSPADEHVWINQLTELAKKEKIWIVCGHPSYLAQPEKDINCSCVSGKLEHSLYNAASLITPEGCVGTYAKVHLFDKEPDLFTSGDSFPIWNSPWGRISVQICYDLEFPEAARISALRGADFILYPSNNMHPYSEFHRTFALARAMENQVFVVYNNRIGIEQETEFCGGSGIAHPHGYWLESCRIGSLLFFNVPEKPKIVSELDYFKYRQPSLYSDLCQRNYVKTVQRMP